MIGTFHHIGYACRSLDKQAKVFEGLGYRVEGERFTDTTQMISGLFMTGAGPRIELIEPTCPESPVTGYLQRGQKMYHLAYEVADMATAVESMKALGAKVVVAPVSAIAFGGRDICFVMLPTLDLIELIQAPR